MHVRDPTTANGLDNQPPQQEINGVPFITDPNHIADGTKFPIPEYTPMKLSGALDKYESFKLTPLLGTEFPTASLKEWANAPNADELLRDLAILSMFLVQPSQRRRYSLTLVSYRGVVFFRNQTDMTDEDQKEITNRIGLLGGKPKNHGLHRHPMAKPRGLDPEVSKVDVQVQAKTHLLKEGVRQTHANEWHSDMTFEMATPDFSALRFTIVPEVGGDTNWASGYELYDRLTPAYRRFLEEIVVGVRGTPNLRDMCQKEDVDWETRGSPLNNHTSLHARHGVVRTHPVTGYRSLWGLGLHLLYFEDMTPEESTTLKDKLTSLIANNHDLQVRFRWKGAGDMAIWDNRCTHHCGKSPRPVDTSIRELRKLTANLFIAGTRDEFDLGRRLAFRCISVGEPAFLDPKSKSRKETWAEQSERGEQITV